MKNKYIKYLFIIILMFFWFIPKNTFASTSEYTIDDYDINIIVNEDNTLDITERITAYFNVSKHGIFRKIPLKNTITRTDGSKSKNMAKISNIDVSETYTKYNENGYKIIKIGSSNHTFTGSRSYIIKYKYNLGKDPLKNADELYFNLIGDEWDTSISNIKFTITMPKAFDKSLLGFSSGAKGSTYNSNVSYNVNGNTITGMVNNTLYSGEALTIRLTLPEGYFVGASLNIDLYSIYVIILSLIFVLIADRLWAKYGKDDEVIETVEFYPPEGHNSAEVQFLYTGESNNKGVISLLVYLADKGYLKIQQVSNNLYNNSVKVTNNKKEKIELKIKELENKIQQEKLRDINSPKIRVWENSLEIFKNFDKPVEYDGFEKEKLQLNNFFEKQNNKFRIVKLKDYDGDNAYEMVFFEGLFNNYSNDSVTISDLYNNFYITLNRIKATFNSKKSKNKVFDSVSTGIIKWLIGMIIAIFVLINVKPVLEYGERGQSLFALLFPGIGFTVFIGSLLGTIKIPKIFGLIWGGMFGGIPWTFMVLPILIQNTMYLIMYIVGIICISVLVLYVKIMPKRTPYGNQMLGKLRGFKRFLETAEKHQLESLVAQNPEYFYNILPYTYALGVSDVWISQFEAMALQAPDWYDSSEPFDMHTFGTFMDATMESASTAMISTPSSGSSGGGDSSGGGSSGGGSGGGGGGSW